MNPVFLRTRTGTDRRHVWNLGAATSLAALLALCAVAAMPVPVAAAQTFYVAPHGSPTNPGTMSAPLDLATALSTSSPAVAGDTIWLRGGVYQGSFVSHLRGTASAPIIVRQFPGERATIDSTGSRNSALVVNGAYVWFWGFEIRNTHPARESSDAAGSDIIRGAGVTSHAPGAKYINLVIHDMRIGLESWSGATDSEIYGNLIYHNGYGAPDRGHGHGIYTQNKTGVKRFTDNILFGGYAYGIHAYGSSTAFLNNLQFEGNVVFNSGILGPLYERNFLVGGQVVAQHPVVNNNFSYYGHERRQGENNLGYTAGCVNLQARNNYWAHAALGNVVSFFAACGPAFESNTIIGGIESSTRTKFPNNLYQTTLPTGVRTFVRPNKYEAGRANIIVYNWDKRDAVDVALNDIGLASGDGYEVRDVQNYFGDPVATGVFDGSAIRIPMTGTTAVRPAGNVSYVPPHTGRQFGTFIIAKTTAAAPPAGQSNVAITLKGPSGPVALGTALQYSLVVSNTGSTAAASVAVQSNFSAAVQWGARSTTQGTCSTTGALSCSLGSLAAGASATVTLSVVPTGAGSLVHTANVTSGSADANAGDNTASSTLMVQQASGLADVAITQTSTPAQPAVGQDLVITVTTTNRGQAPASNVDVRLAVRAEPWVIRSFVASTSGCTQPVSMTLSCKVATLAAGASRTDRFTIRTGMTGTVASTATVSTSSAETGIENNISTASTKVVAAGTAAPAPVEPTPAEPVPTEPAPTEPAPTQPPPPTAPAEPEPAPGAAANLAIAGAISHVTDSSGRKIVVRLNVRNLGVAEPAVRVSNIVRSYPWVIQSVSATASQGKCSGSFTLSCDLGAMAAGASAVVEVVLVPRLVNTFTSEARVTGSLADSDASNNVIVLNGSTQP